MRALATIVLAAVISGFVAGTVQLEMGVAFGAKEEFIVASVGEVLLVLVAATFFAVALLASASPKAVNGVAIGLAVAVVVALVTLEAFTIATGASAAAVAHDLPILAEIGIPALLTILIQWWLVRRHMTKAALTAAATA